MVRRGGAARRCIRRCTCSSSKGRAGRRRRRRLVAREPCSAWHAWGGGTISSMLLRCSSSSAAASASASLRCRRHRQHCRQDARPSARVKGSWPVGRDPLRPTPFMTPQGRRQPGENRCIPRAPKAQRAKMWMWPPPPLPPAAQQDARPRARGGTGRRRVVLHTLSYR